MIKACLFDLDGTLLDTLTTISYYGNLALERFGFSPIEKEKYKYLIGNGAKILIDRMLKSIDAYSEEMSKKVYDFYNESYNSDTLRYTKPYDGIVDMLCDIKKRKILSGIISNKPDFATRSVVKEIFDKSLIDSVRGQVDGVPIKPAVDGPMFVLNEMKVLPSETIYIGDSGVDMQTGKNIGAFTIGVSWGFREEKELIENGADLIVKNPHEIIEYIDSTI